MHPTLSFMDNATDRAIPGPRHFNPLAFVRSMRNPSAWLHRTARAYGDPFKVNITFGPMVVTGDPEIVRVLFTTDPDAFEPFLAGDYMQMKLDQITVG